MRSLAEARLQTALTVEGVGFSLIAPFGAIELRNCVGTKFVTMMRYAVFVILTRSQRALNYDANPFRKGFLHIRRAGRYFDTGNKLAKRREKHKGDR